MSVSVTLKSIPITLGAANIAKKLSETPVRVPWFELYITSGGSTCYLGDSTVTSSFIPRGAGTLTAFNASERGDFSAGDYFDLSKLYLVSATAGATAVLQYPVVAPE